MPAAQPQPQHEQPPPARPWPARAGIFPNAASTAEVVAEALNTNDAALRGAWQWLIAEIAGSAVEAEGCRTPAYDAAAARALDAARQAGASLAVEDALHEAINIVDEALLGAARLGAVIGWSLYATQGGIAELDDWIRRAHAYAALTPALLPPLTLGAYALPDGTSTAPPPPAQPPQHGAQP
jgi:hypothetical protein